LRHTAEKERQWKGMANRNSTYRGKLRVLHTLTPYRFLSEFWHMFQTRTPTCVKYNKGRQFCQSLATTENKKHEALMRKMVDSQCVFSSIYIICRWPQVKKSSGSMNSSNIPPLGNRVWPWIDCYSGLTITVYLYGLCTGTHLYGSRPQTIEHIDLRWPLSCEIQSWWYFQPSLLKLGCTPSLLLSLYLPLPF